MTTIDITATGSLADALKACPTATPLLITINGKQAVSAVWMSLSDGIRLELSDREPQPTLEQTVAALNAELVESPPELSADALFDKAKAAATEEAGGTN